MRLQGKYRQHVPCRTLIGMLIIKQQLFCLSTLEQTIIVAVCEVYLRIISKQSYLLLQEESVLNLNIPCEVLLTLLLASEGEDKKIVCMCVEREERVWGTNIGSTGESARRGMGYCAQVVTADPEFS